MPARPAFVLFGPAHLWMLAAAVFLPLALALAARRRASLDRPIRFGLAALLAGGWLCWYALFWMRGWLTPGNGLPLNLCDWAALALIAVLTMGGQRAYELGYFWGLGGSLQGLITPDIAYDFPDPQFIFFFINHAGIIVALLYLSFTGFRPVPASLVRVLAATIFYVLVAAAMDYLLGVNYGFLAAKPATASIMDFLSPWPWYIPELVLIGFLSLLVYYAPWFALDRLSPNRNVGRGPSSRITSTSGPSS
jgi:hypothetical integral membrane protein (TIGR02206 family)